MKTLIADSELFITPLRDFNILTAREIEKACVEKKKVIIDLSKAKIVDTEALMCLYRLEKMGKKVVLHDPPDIYYEVLRILKLEKLFRGIEVISKEKPS